MSSSSNSFNSSSSSSSSTSTNTYSSLTEMTWYTPIQTQIDFIINTGDISALVGGLATLFISVPSIYIGSDQAPHAIVYEPFTIQANINNVGYLPVGTISSIQNIIYTSDAEQNEFSMKPLINYVVAYNKLKAFASSNNSLGTPLDYGTYQYFIQTHNALIAYFNKFGDNPTYQVRLYQFATNKQLLKKYLDCIKTKIITNSNFLQYLTDLTTYYTPTVFFQVGQANEGVYALSRAVAFNARRGTSTSFSIP